MFFIRLFLANTSEKKSGVTVLVSSQTAVKGGHGFEIEVTMKNLGGGDWGGCFYVFDVANTEIQT